MYKALWVLFLGLPCFFCVNANLQESIKTIKPSIVAIGIHNPLSSPRIKLIGTGFAVGDGSKIITNYHVIAKTLDTRKNETYVVLSGQADNLKVHPISDTKSQMSHDLAVLTINEKLPALKLADSPLKEEGTEIAFTGFPITGVLGLYPATHKGIISAITPIARPADNSGQLQAAALRQLRKPFMVYQLDATAYPGNSGSPLYDVKTSEVIGILNQVYVKSTRESAITDPSGITYAIPVQFLLPLLNL